MSVLPTDLLIAFEKISLLESPTVEMTHPLPPTRIHCSSCGQEGHRNTSKSCPKRVLNVPTIVSAPSDVSSDSYTREILREMYDTHMAYVKSRIESGKRLQIRFRLPCIPEDISENIIKFTIHRHGDTMSRWDCKGDLLSSKVGKQECKCFTSDGPLSFTPSSEWDEIYFMDARNWLDHRFIIWKCTLRRNSDEWKQIRVSKTQTFEDQCLQGRRPRISWDSLYPQIQAYCEKIAEGILEDIIGSI